jgi:predicted CXXCH cytochrome family protein
MSRILFLVFGLLFTTSAHAADGNGNQPQSQPESAGFVTSQVCAGCHVGEAEAWQDSHHAAAMAVASDQTVLAPFRGETFIRDDNTTTFFRHDGKFFVNTDGPDGKLADFEIAYTFGFTPLQQYLVAMPGGRNQALGIAWDSRPEKAGGQRWFHLYPDTRLVEGDPLHWTGIDQNWNYQCAWCHSTNLKKNYDPQQDIFATTWSEINVGCEACHGPGATHVEWARGAAAGGDNGLQVQFDERKNITWTMRDIGTVIRSAPRRSSTEIDVCAGCHARRSQFSDVHAATFFDAFRPSLIEQDLYYPDGQQEAEVYKYGSFMQSKMHEQGVTCSDCHDPHSGKLRLEGNSLCGQCHEPDRFDTPAHHHHAQQSAGAQCVSCHMPPTNYMIVDGRHDHSLRIPRPDLSIALRVPNACNGCHENRDAQWAEDALRQWYPQPNRGFQDFAELFAASDRVQPGSREALVRYLDGTPLPIVAASAMARLARNPSPDALRAAARSLSSLEPLLRSAAVGVVGQADPQNRLRLLEPLLSDKSRLVRMDAARALAGETESLMDAATRSQFENALAEYVDGQAFNSERPEANANLANLALERGDIDTARRYYETARQRDASFVPATVGLAQLLGSQGDAQAAESMLREAEAKQPDSADIAHALGLLLVRAGARDEAIGFLQKAARLGPENPRFAYVYAVALHDTGSAEQAIVALESALQRHPFNWELLNALVSYQIERGDLKSALESAETLLALEPDNPAAQRLVTELRQNQQP